MGEMGAGGGRRWSLAVPRLWAAFPGCPPSSPENCWAVVPGRCASGASWAIVPGRCPLIPRDLLGRFVSALPIWSLVGRFSWALPPHPPRSPGPPFLGAAQLEPRGPPFLGAAPIPRVLHASLRACWAAIPGRCPSGASWAAVPGCCPLIPPTPFSHGGEKGGPKDALYVTGRFPSRLPRKAILSLPLSPTVGEGDRGGEGDTLGSATLKGLRGTRGGVRH